MSALSAAWDSRSPGERRVLAFGGATAAVLLFFALVWLPLARANARLERDVPALRTQVAALERDAAEVRRLRALPPLAAGTPSQPLATLAQGALAPPPGVKLALSGNDRVRLSGDDVGFAPLLRWLAATQAAQGLRVDRARIEALPAPGRVRVDITLARS